MQETSLLCYPRQQKFIYRSKLHLHPHSHYQNHHMPLLSRSPCIQVTFLTELFLKQLSQQRQSSTNPLLHQIFILPPSEYNQQQLPATIVVAVRPEQHYSQPWPFVVVVAKRLLPRLCPLQQLPIVIVARQLLRLYPQR